MPIDHSLVEDTPVITAVLDTDSTGELTIDTRTEAVTGASLPALRAALMQRVIAVAAALGRPVRMTTMDESGSTVLVVSPDGAAEPAPGSRNDGQDSGALDSGGEAGMPSPGEASPSPRRSAPSTRTHGLGPAETPVPAEHVGPAAAGSRREARASFLRQEQAEKPAARGLRGMLARAGIRMAPSGPERAERVDEQAVSRHWPGPRTIAIVNGKGGAGKTPTTIMLAAVFARYGGAGVLAWDNNQTRGTLGWRTEQGPHEATLLDLLPATDRLLSTSAQSADLAHFVHHQTRDRFDVLRSKPVALAHEQRITPDDVDAIHSVASKYYRLVFIDSGNDESDPMWLRMIDHADQIVVATTTRADHAEAGALLLEALAERDETSAKLARKAVAIITQADPTATKTDLQHVADGYGRLARAVVQIPHDPALVDGQISYETLRPATQRAWLSAAASVARGL